jgi:hypothetical protein
MRDLMNVPGLTQVQQGLQISDDTFYGLYGARMVEAAEAGIESQRRWTLYHMGCVEGRDEDGNKEWQRVAEPVKIPEAVFGLRARMFARLQEGVAHMGALKPKEDCPLPEDEMRHIAHALGHEFIVSNMKQNGRGYYVDACLAEGKPLARVGMDHEVYNSFKRTNPQWIDEDYRAHLGYRAILLAAARDLKEAPMDPAQETKIKGVFGGV